MAQALEVIIWDVQHGSAALIKTPTGKKLAIDLGVGSFLNPTDATFSPLRHLRYKYGFTELDGLLITHPHTDHLDDIVNLHLIPPKILMAPMGIDRDLIRKGNQKKDSSIINAYFELIDRYNQPVTPGEEMSNPTTWGCSIERFFPVYDGPNLNNYSIVTVIKYAGSSIIIPGDNEAPSWKSLLDQPRFVSAIQQTNVFVASHHGRESGYYTDLFKQFKPNLCIVSDTNDISTSVTDKYTYQAQGMPVYNRKTREYEERKAVTTRSDDSIYIKCWTEWDANAGRTQNYIDAHMNVN